MSTVTMVSRGVNPTTLVTETLHRETIYGVQDERMEVSPTEKKRMRNRLKREQRKVRRLAMKVTADVRKTRDKEARRQFKVKNSVKLQRRAIKGYWKSGVGHSQEASLADQDLLQHAKTFKERQDILLGETVSYERDKLRKQMSYAFKRASMALQLLQQKDMLTDGKQDVRLIEKQDIDSIVLRRKIVKK